MTRFLFHNFFPPPTTFSCFSHFLLQIPQEQSSNLVPTECSTCTIKCQTFITGLAELFHLAQEARKGSVLANFSARPCHKSFIRFFHYVWVPSQYLHHYVKKLNGSFSLLFKMNIARNASGSWIYACQNIAYGFRLLCY